jgi:hypothetical protein
VNRLGEPQIRVVRDKVPGTPGGAFAYNLGMLSHLRYVENGRAWVSDPAAARSENVALPSIFVPFV